MKRRVPSYYKAFECIAGACEDTCCRGWDVVIEPETYQCYQKMEGPFGEVLRNKMIVDDDGDNIFILDGDRCPFLNDQNLCDIYKEKGEACLSHTCKQYPRYREEFHDLREIGLSLSCPEAARIILRNQEATKFDLSMDVQGSDSPQGSDEVLEDFFQCRAMIIDILEMAELPLGTRTGIVLKLVEDVQDKVDFNELDAIELVIENYSQRTYIDELKQIFDRNEADEGRKYQNVNGYFKTYRDLEHINTKDPLGLNKVLNTFWTSDTDRSLYMAQHRAFNLYYKDEMINFQKILIYFTYRYFMKSYYDYDMSSKIKMALMSTIMIKELAVVRWMDNGQFTEADMVDIAYKYSRDVEHLEKNVASLERIFETEDLYSVDNLLNTLMSEF